MTVAPEALQLYEYKLAKKRYEECTNMQNERTLEKAITAIDTLTATLSRVIHIQCETTVNQR